MKEEKEKNNVALSLSMSYKRITKEYVLMKYILNPP
jgi:hypothetical protein